METRKTRVPMPPPAESAPKKNTSLSECAPRRDRHRAWIPFVAGAGLIAIPLLAILLLLWQSGMFARSGGSRIVSPGMRAPDFEIGSLDQRTFRLDNYRGRAVFLAFVPAWDDARTIAEIRSLATTLPHFDAAGAKILVVSGDDPAKAAAMESREKLPFPLLLDRGNRLAKLYGVPPGLYRTTFVVSPAGLVKYRVGDAAVDAARHGQQLLDASKCCIDEVMAARAHGVGRTVGDFSLPLAQSGAMATVYGDGKQRATVVVFLSVKCPCSNAYNTRLAALAQQFARQPVRFVGVYSNQDETAAEIAEHARKNGFGFPVFKDDRALCADHFGAGVTPEAFVIDSRQVLRYAGRIDDSRDPAEVKNHDVAAAVQSLLSGGTVTTTDTRAFGCAIVRR